MMTLGVGAMIAKVRNQILAIHRLIAQWTDCLKLTKAVQKTAETLQTVADLYDDHVCAKLFACAALHSRLLQARRRQLATHEALKSVAHPYMIYQVCYTPLNFYTNQTATPRVLSRPIDLRTPDMWGPPATT